MDAYTVAACDNCFTAYKTPKAKLGQKACCARCGSVFDLKSAPEGTTATDMLDLNMIVADLASEIPISHQQPTQAKAISIPNKDGQVLITVDDQLERLHHSSNRRGDFALVGNTDAVCPNCMQGLEKKPGKKKKCPHCEKFIYVRTRPSDRQQVLVSETQAEQIEEQWSIVNGTHDVYLAQKKRFADEKANLAMRFGREPSDNDVRWSQLNQDLIQHAQQRDWGFFRNDKLAMAEILRKEGRLSAALELYLEICYLDLNGPNNTGGYADRELLREFPPWNAKDGSLAPGLLELAASIIQKTNLALPTVEEIYGKRASLLHKSLRLPLSPAKAWPQIRKALFD